MGKTIEAAIRKTLDRMDGSEFRREANDCCAIMADYVQLLTGSDPMAGLRGAYCDDAGAERLIADGGGVGNMVADGMRSVGIKEKPGCEAVRGDVVIVSFRGEEIVGLFLDPFVACKSRHGRLMRRWTIEKAWPPCA